MWPSSQMLNAISVYFLNILLYYTQLLYSWVRTWFSLGMVYVHTLFYPDHTSSSFQIIPPLGRCPVCATFYPCVNNWLCKFVIFSRCIRASIVHPFVSKCRNCVAYVFKKNKSVQSASYLFILLGVPIEIHSECKAFIEICSPTDFLIWVFLCHLSFGYEPTTYSCGFTIELEAWMPFSLDMWQPV